MSKEKITKLIAANAVMVFSKSYCPYCSAAKQLLKSLNQPFEAYELDLESDGGELQKQLQQMTGQRTVPNIFIRQQHIGGCDDLRSLHSQGKLESLLKGK
jgi:glutaredoxin 3